MTVTTEPGWLAISRNITHLVRCTYCGAIAGDNCLEMLRGHVHWCRLERARCQHPDIMTHELYADTLNYVLGRNDDALTQQSDV